LNKFVQPYLFILYVIATVLWNYFFPLSKKQNKEICNGPIENYRYNKVSFIIWIFIMNPYSVVSEFENKVAEYAGSKFAVAVDNCTNAIFLCCKYLNIKNATIPSRTYVSVPCSIINAGARVDFVDFDWRDEGFYKLDPHPIYDAAHLFNKNMYIKNSYFCISFSATKTINIGKGGMILTDDGDAVDWFKQARYCGRHEVPLMKDNFQIIGWNMYMTPEQAARGLLLLNHVKDFNQHKKPEYPDLSKYKIYKN
jgi:dTDP-4-amino-4,6-dideoxygalactose transaminase